MEAMVVMVIITILALFAVPYSQQWIRNSEYKAAARSMVNILRAMRNNAINKNLEHRVEFESGAKRFRVIQGNKSIDSNECIRSSRIVSHCLRRFFFDEC